MRQAFAEFMISGKGSSKNKEKPSSQVQSPSIDRAAREATAFKKQERKYWQIINAFQGTLQRDWLDVDDNLGRVMDSISSLRERIAAESRQLRKQKETPTKRWQGHGFRSRSSSLGLTPDDVQLALTHDLLRHEKMMAGARMLIASLSEAQDTLGRRLEESMLHDMETQLLAQNMVPIGIPCMILISL